MIADYSWIRLIKRKGTGCDVLVVVDVVVMVTRKPAAESRDGIN